jgi:hypothetical protein
MSTSDSDLARLAEEAGFIFRGRVTGHGTTEPSLAAASRDVVTVEIEEVLHSTDALRGLAGSRALVVTTRAAALLDGTTTVFFTNCLVVGSQLVVREIAHVDPRVATQQAAEAVKVARERPLRRRLAAAARVVAGTVIDASPLEENAPRRSEHDPDWWVARVQVHAELKGGERPKAAGEGPKSVPVVEVLFANSTDIAWYQSPKLHKGTSGVLLLHHVAAEDVPAKVARPMHKVVDPLDFIPNERRPEVERALANGGAEG